jgi:hypothetical protein
LLMAAGVFDRIVTGKMSVASIDIQLLPPLVQKLLLVVRLMCKYVDLPLGSSQYPPWLPIWCKLERCLAS